MIKKKKQFSTTFLNEIKKVLLEERDRLKEELDKFTKKNPHVKGDYDSNYPEYGDKDDENALEVAQYTTNKPLEITLEKALRDVNKTLERIDRDDYGICKYCDKPIEEKRLLARPTSSACVSCKKTLTQEA